MPAGAFTPRMGLPASHAAAPPAEDPDRPLMERIRAGDQEAVVELVGRYQDQLVGFFYRLSWDQGLSEELAQDVFVGIYRARERWVASARVRTWLYRCAHNRWLDHVRRRRRLQALPEDDLAAAPPPPPDDPEQRALVRERVQRAIDDLTEGQRLVFVLANHQGLRYGEIAAVLGIPEGTVKSRMHHAVRALREALADLVEE